MFRIPRLLCVAAILMLFGLAACEEVTQADREALAAQRQVEADARALRRGNAAVASCRASRCGLLNIDGLRLADYSILNELTHVTALMASRTDLVNLNDISGMRQLTELHITGSKVSDLSPLRNFPNLKLLHLEWMPTSVDISPIGQLTGLTELALGNLGERDDVSFVRQMSKLEKLKIYWDEGDADISVLRGHPSLEMVEIAGILPPDQSALLTMPKLKSILLDSFGTLNQDVQDELERQDVLEFREVMVVC